MLTFADCQNDIGLQAVANCAPTDPKFAYLVNTSVQRLMRRGDWLGTISPMLFCVRNGCVVFPRYVGTIRKMNRGGRELEGRNLWYQFIDPREYRGCGGETMAWTHTGQSPLYSDVWGDGRLLRFYPSTPEDVGKTVTIWGLDNNNQPLRTDNGDGTWSDGITVTLALPYGSTSTYVRKVYRARKDVTQGQVFVYGYNAAADTGVAPSLGLEDLAIWDPGETNPDYKRYSIHSGRSSACCGASRSVLALVKLQFIPVRFPTDWVLIDNLEALKFEFQSVAAGEANNFADQRAAEAEAVAELNRQLEDAFPDDVFSARDNVFGGMRLRNRCF